MYEAHKIITDILGLFQFTDISQFLLPKVGVGAEIEAKEIVSIAPLLKYTLIFLAGMSTVFGFVLAFAAKKFAVKIDPRVEQVNDVLAHAHCGACGYAGCEQYAEAVVKDPNVSPSLCIPAGEKAALKVAEITGKKAEIKEKELARVICQGGWSKSQKKYAYEGVLDCRAAVLAGGGDKSCIYGCLGYGTCEIVCPFDAIKMGSDNLPIIDKDKCTACRKCEAACPKKVIEVLPAAKAVLVSCHSRDKGADVRKACKVGCIACGMCVKVCPFDAPKIDKNLARIDMDKCRVCGLCVAKCPTNAIEDFIAPRTKASVLDNCIGCQICAKACPVEAITGENKKKHVINQGKCIGCGICAIKCPVQAIGGTFNAEQIRIAKQKEKAKKAAVA
jgi:electron transport complex protein RnfB